jgi:hypothetical protein
MKKFVFLTYGFVKPTPEIMAAWGTWFKSFADKVVDKSGHFNAAREISKSGTKDLPLGADSITGFMVINAASIDEAETIAKRCPIMDLGDGRFSSIRVYELMSM